MMIKEKKIYILNANEINFDFPEALKKKQYDKIMTKAEELGTIYSLKGFEDGRWFVRFVF